MQLLILFFSIVLSVLCRANDLTHSADQVLKMQNTLQNILQQLKTQSISLLENDQRCFQSSTISTLNCVKIYIQIKHNIMDLNSDISYLSLNLSRIESDFLSSKEAMADSLENTKSWQNLLMSDCNKKIEQIFKWNSEHMVLDFRNRLAHYKYKYTFHLLCKDLPYHAEKTNLEATIALNEKAPYTILYAYKTQILNILAIVDQFKLLCPEKVNTKNLESLLPLLQKQLTTQNFTKNKMQICRSIKPLSFLSQQDCQNLPATPWSTGLLNQLQSFREQP